MVLTRSKKRAMENNSSDETQSKKPKPLEEPLNESDSDNSFSVNSSDSDDDSDEDWVATLVEDEDDEEGVISINAAGLVKLLEKTNPEASENLKKVLETIDERTPNFMKLLIEDLEHEHRVKLFELYEALKEYEAAGAEGQPCKLEYLSLRDHINDLTKKYKKKKLRRNKLSEKLKESIKKTKEKMEDVADDDDALENKILNLVTCSTNRVAIYNKYKRFDKLPRSDDEKAKLQAWLHWATSIPYDKIKHTSQGMTIPQRLAKLALSLEEELFGMTSVKEQILTFVNSRLINPTVKGCSLALIGPPGTGKTSIAKLLSSSLETPFAQMSFGGVKNADFLKGHDFCYVGSRPGEIVRCLARMKYKNGILFMDEFEKISSNKEITSTLLHVIDPQQNFEFRDNYLRELTLDLSNIWFIYSMNNSPTDSALNDRIFKIKVPGYSTKEKVSILRKYSLRKILKNLGLENDCIKISKEISEYLVQKISPKKSGVREVEQALRDLVSKISFLVNNNGAWKEFPFKISFRLSRELTFPVSIDRDMIDKFLSKKTDNLLPMMYL